MYKMRGLEYILVLISLKIVYIAATVLNSSETTIKVGSFIERRIAVDLSLRIFENENQEEGIEIIPYLKNFNKTFSYHVSIEESENHACSGALLEPGNIVITAAFCVKDWKTKNLIVRGNTGKEEEGGIIANITDVEFSGGTSVKERRLEDIALLLLNRKLPVKPIQMIGNIVYHDKHFEGFVTGWNNNQYETYNSYLIATKVQIYLQKECKKFYASAYDNVLCAGYYEMNVPYCDEDRGSPLAVDYKLYGISIMTQGCSESIMPTIFANVAYHQKWIKNSIKKLTRDN